MEATSIGHSTTAAPMRGRAGWLVGMSGLAGVVWWIRTWSNVQTLINDHTSAHGPPPTSPMERSALYANGTPAEQRLNSDLDSISGLYPWGPMPLFLAGLVALIGFLLAGRQNRTFAALAIGVTMLLVVVSSSLLWDTMTVALDVLE